MTERPGMPGDRMKWKRQSLTLTLTLPYNCNINAKSTIMLDVHGVQHHKLYGLVEL